MRPRGYTLIEVLVVVTLLGIVAAMAIPSLGQAGVLRTQAAVRSIVADITFAQADAVAYQRGRAVMFDAANTKYTLVEVVPGSALSTTDALYDTKGPGNKYERSLTDTRYGGIVLQNVDFNGGTNLVFDELGGPVGDGTNSDVSTGGSIDVLDPNGRRFRISVAAFTGRVTVAQVN